MPTKVHWTPALTLAFQVRDRAATARWYETMLGFRLLYDVEEARWCELATPIPGVTLGLSEEESQGGGGPVPTFAVADVDAARAALEAAGVDFEGPTIVIEGTAKLATLLDPDGHRLMLSEDLQGGGA